MLILLNRFLNTLRVSMKNFVFYTIVYHINHAEFISPNMSIPTIYVEIFKLGIKC